MNKDLEVAYYFLQEAVNMERKLQNANFFLEAKAKVLPTAEVLGNEVMQIPVDDQPLESANGAHCVEGEACLDDLYKQNDN